MPVENITPSQEAILQGEGEGLDPILPAEITNEEDGGATVEFLSDPLEEVETAEAEVEHTANLAEFIDDEDLDHISARIMEKVEADEESRGDWLNILKDSIKLLGLRIEEISEPFEGACSATHPLLIESTVKFQAKAYTELFPSAGPVRTKVVGAETPQRLQQSFRVQEFMNYEVMDLMDEYGPELDRLLFYVGLAGSAFKKTYYDPILDRPMSQFVTAEDFVVPYYATSLASCSRYTHKINMSHNDILKNQISGFYRELELGDAREEEPNVAEQEHDKVHGRQMTYADDDIHPLYETHTDLDLPGFEHINPSTGEPSGIALPYIVTIDVDSTKILAIRRNWRDADKRQKKRMYFTHYQFVPGLGFYGYGYLHLIGGLARTSTATMRQLVDAGTFATLPAGFKAHGLRVVGDASPFQPGEFKDVHAPAMDLTKSIIPLPFKEPSATLMNLLEFVVKAAEKFADSTEALISEASTYGPVGTIMALLEQGGKLFSVIHKRLHMAQGQDFKILAELNYEWLPNSYPYEIAGGAQNVFKEDFNGRVDVIPVSDPNMPTQSHRIAKAQAIFSIATQAPQEHNMPEVLRGMYEALEEDPKKVTKYLKEKPKQAQPLDLVTENQNALAGKALKSGPAQNHSAHIKGHFDFGKLPAVKKNKMAAQALMGHIQEHLAQDYRVRIERMLGQQLPPAGQPLPPEIEEKIAIAASAATEQMLQDDVMQQIMDDPEMMLAWKGLDVEAEKAQQKFQIEQAKLVLQEAGMQIDAEDADLDRRIKLQIAKIQANSKKE